MGVERLNISFSAPDVKTYKLKLIAKAVRRTIVNVLIGNGLKVS